MTKGIDITLDLLAKSKNRTAVKLLDAAFHSTDESVRKQAGTHLIQIRGSKGIMEMIRLFDPTDRNMIDLFQENRDRVISALRIAISGKDTMLARNALRVANSLRFFEVIPLLLAVFMDQGALTTEDSTLENSILRLAEKYIQALEERRNRNFLYGKIMPEIVEVLAKGLNDYHRNDPPLFLKLFVYFYVYWSDVKPEVMRPFENPSSTAYLALFRLLLSEKDKRFYHFVFYSLDNPYPMSIASTVFAKRSDTPFLNAVLKEIGTRVTAEMRVNLRKIRNIEWLENLPALLERLSGDAQIGLISLLRTLDLSPGELQARLMSVFLNGKTETRCEALRVLVDTPGTRTDKLVWDASGDADPGVQIQAFELLQKVAPDKAASRMLQFAGSPHPVVREKIKMLLPEFRFVRFLEAFDQMTEDQRRIMFRIVRDLDVGVDRQLADMLDGVDPLTKARALLCIEYGNIIPAMEEAICRVLLHETNVKLRVRAAVMLAEGRRDVSRSTLVQAMHRDTDPEVRAAAKDSLTRRPAAWATAPPTSGETQS